MFQNISKILDNEDILKVIFNHKGKTNTIGLIIADIANPFFGTLGREIEKETSRHGYRVIFCSSDENPDKSKQQIAMLLQSLVDGYIISPPIHSEEQIQSLVRSHIPYVLSDRYFPEIDSNYVGINNFDAADYGNRMPVGNGHQNS